MDNCNLDGEIKTMYVADYRDIPNVKVTGRIKAYEMTCKGEKLRSPDNDSTEWLTRKQAANIVIKVFNEEKYKQFPNTVLLASISGFLRELENGEHGLRIIAGVRYEY